MKTTTNHQKIKVSLLKAMGELQEQKKAQVAERVVNLPFLSKLPGIKALKREINANTKKIKRTTVQTVFEAIPPKGFDHCFSPPYMYNFPQPFNTHAHVLPDYQQIRNIFSTVAWIDAATGEISLAAVSGINCKDVYGGEIDLGFGAYITHNTSCATVSQLIGIDPKPYERVVTVHAEASLPERYEDVVKLVPGPSWNDAHGLVGVEGFLDVYIGGPFALDHEHVTHGNSVNFLHSWVNAQNEIPEHIYHPRPTNQHSFKLPANADQFWISVLVQVNAYSDYVIHGDDTPMLEYALVDLRVNEASHIWREDTGRDDRDRFPRDHPNPGPAKIKKICYRIEPSHVPSTPPNTH